MKLADLKENPQNPRLAFTEEQGKAFAAAYSKFGDLGPVVANRRFDFRLVGGHKRKGALSDAFPNAAIQLEQELNEPDEQGTVAWGWIDTGKGRYALRVVDWDEATEAAANLAANKFGAEFDWQGVSELLQSINGKIDLSMTGFLEHELDNLLKATWKPDAIEDMPTTDHADRITLHEDERTLLNQCKERMKEADDATALRRLCEHYLSGVPS